MIPVLGVPILNEPERLQLMLASVDVEVGRLVIVDNGGVIPPNDDPRMTVVRPGYNLGVAASWNLMMKITPNAPWWCIVNHDIEFAPGDLQRLINEMRAGGLVMLGGMAAFGISHPTVKTVGFFDEDFAPAYFEDNDYDYRCRLAGVNIRALPAGMLHSTSSTIRADERLQAENRRTFRANRARYIEKWGGTPYQETYTTPFAAGSSPYIGPDIERLALHAWRTT